MKAKRPERTLEGKGAAANERRRRSVGSAAHRRIRRDGCVRIRIDDATRDLTGAVKCKAAGLGEAGHRCAGGRSTVEAAEIQRVPPAHRREPAADRLPIHRAAAREFVRVEDGDQRLRLVFHHQLPGFAGRSRLHRDAAAAIRPDGVAAAGDADRPADPVDHSSSHCATAVKAD